MSRFEKKEGKLCPFLYVVDAKLSEFLQIFRHLACHETILPIDIGHEIHEKKREKNVSFVHLLINDSCCQSGYWVSTLGVQN